MTVGMSGQLSPHTTGFITLKHSGMTSLVLHFGFMQQNHCE
jgi:hypothetical protein